MRIKPRYLFIYFYIIFTTMFYILKETRLNFKGLGVFLVIGLLSGLLGIEFNLRHQKYKWGLIVLLIISILFHSKVAYDSRMIIAAISIISCMFYEPKDIVKPLFYSHLIFFTIAMIAGGTGHINSIGMNIAVIMVLYICKREGQIRGIRLLILWMIYFMTIAYTKSGSYLISIGFGLILTTFMRFTRIKSFLTSRFVQYIYPIVFVTNIALCLCLAPYYFPFVRKAGFVFIYINKFAEIINTISSSRIILGAESIHRYGVSLLGANIHYDTLFDGITYFQVDSGMLWLLQGWGILMTLVVMVLFTYMMKRFVEKRMYSYIIAGIVIALISMNEDILVSIQYNVMFLFLGCTFNKNELNPIIDKLSIKKQYLLKKSLSYNN